MPGDNDKQIWGIAKGIEFVGDTIEFVGDTDNEMSLKVDMSQSEIELLKKRLQEIQKMEGQFDQNIFKHAGTAFKEFASAEKVLKDPEEEFPKDPWPHKHGSELLVYYPRNAKQGEPYADHTVNPGWLNFHNIKDLLARFFITIHANHGTVNNWRDLCIGITSTDSRGRHVPMFDYDGSNIKTRVKKDVKLLQNKFELGDATIYETRRGLHIYFFSDRVTTERYREMLNSVACCKGFRESFNRAGYAVLRVSAKYTEFDIFPYKVIVSPNRAGTRPGKKAAIIQELLRLGQECGTHLASQYPQWAKFKEDVLPWKASGNGKARMKIKKISHEEYKKMKEEAFHKHVAKGNAEAKEGMYKVMYNAPVYKMDNWVVNNGTSSSTITYTNTSTTNY